MLVPTTTIITIRTTIEISAETTIQEITMQETTMEEKIPILLITTMVSKEKINNGSILADNNNKNV
jgi:hypothetical protein